MLPQFGACILRKMCCIYNRFNVGLHNGCAVVDGTLLVVIGLGLQTLACKNFICLHSMQEDLIFLSVWLMIFYIEKSPFHFPSIFNFPPPPLDLIQWHRVFHLQLSILVNILFRKHTIFMELHSSPHSSATKCCCILVWALSFSFCMKPTNCSINCNSIACWGNLFFDML